MARLRNYLSTNCLSLTAKGVKERVVLIFIFCSQPCANSPSFAAGAILPPFGANFLFFLFFYMRLLLKCKKILHFIQDDTRACFLNSTCHSERSEESNLSDFDIIFGLKHNKKTPAS